MVSLFFVAMEDASNNILEMGNEIFAAVFYFVSFLFRFAIVILDYLFLDVFLLVPLYVYEWLIG
jgi:hypothetical protein